MVCKNRECVKKAYLLAGAHNFMRELGAVQKVPLHKIINPLLKNPS